MSLFIDDKKADLEIIKNGKSITDPVYKHLAGQYQNIYERFFQYGEAVVFVHTKMDGGKNRIDQNVPFRAKESIPRKVSIKTKEFNKILVLADEQLTENGKTVYAPTYFDFVNDTPRMSYKEEDADIVLFLLNTHLFKNGDLVINDARANERKIAGSRGKSGAVLFHLYDEMGDLFGDEDKLNKFCQNWGISIRNKYPEKKKNELSDAIEKAEAANNKEFGYDAFKAAIKNEDPLFDVRYVIQDSLEKELIRYDYKQYKVVYANGEQLFKVPVSEATNWKKSLTEYLAGHPEIISTLMGDTEKTEMPHQRRKVDLPEEVTEDFLRGKSLSYPDKKIVWCEAYGKTMRDAQSMKLPELTEDLVRFFVTDGKKLV